MTPRRLRWLPVLASLGAPVLGTPISAHAQPPTAAVGANRGRIDGMVFDSLIGRPLPGAAVWVHGSGRMVLSAADGRFVLDSVAPGPQTVGASHPALDSLGLPALAAAVQVPAEGTTALAITTPARSRLLRALCGVAPPPPHPARGDRTTDGVLLGAVRDARDGAPVGARLAGAEVTARFVTSGRGSRELPTLRTVSARTDSTGGYVLCGLPVDAELVVRAGRAPAESGPAYVTLGERAVARLDLAVDPTTRLQETSSDSAAPAGAAAPGSTRLVGVVRDTAGAPRPGARVRVADRPDLEVRADSLGRFALGGLARGTQTVVVSAIGYTPQPTTVDVRGNLADTAQIVLQRVVQLAGVTARGRVDRQGAFRAELMRRQRLSMGYFVDSATIERMGSLRGAFTTVPYATVRGSPGRWSIAMWSGPKSITRPSTTCAPDIWLDNFPVTVDVLNDLPADHVLAAEVYRRASQAPIQYTLGTTDHCGVILVWTRSAR